MSNEQSTATRIKQGLDELGTEASDAMNNMARITADNAAIARRRVEGGLDEAKSVLSEVGSAISGQACSAANSTQAYARGHPFAVLGLAIAAGMLIGTLLRHRAVGRGKTH